MEQPSSTAQRKPSLSALARLYGCTPAALKIWETKGANIGCPDRLFIYIETHGERRGPLWELLCRDANREAIGKRIETLIQ